MTYRSRYQTVARSAARARPAARRRGESALARVPARAAREPRPRAAARVRVATSRDLRERPALAEPLDALRWTIVGGAGRAAARASRLEALLATCRAALARARRRAQPRLPGPRRGARASAPRSPPESCRDRAITCCTRRAIATRDEVVSSHNEAHLLPRALATQTPSNVQLRIDPAPDTVRWHQRLLRQRRRASSISRRAHRELTIRTESDVALDPAPRFDPARSAPWEEVAAGVRLAARRPRRSRPFEYVFDSPFVAASEALAAYARPSFAARAAARRGGARLLTHRIHAEFRYDPEATTLDTPVEDALRERHGVCQDFAHVDDRRAALARPARALCQRLPAVAPQGEARGQAGRRGRARRLGGVARVGRGLVPDARLDRGRSDQRPRAERPPHRARVGPRLRRRLAR